MFFGFIKIPERNERGSLPFALLTIVLTASLSVTTISALSFQATKRGNEVTKGKEAATLNTGIARAAEQVSQFETYAVASGKNPNLTPQEWCESLARGQTWKPVAQVSATPNGGNSSGQGRTQVYARWDIACSSADNSSEKIKQGYLAVSVQTGVKVQDEIPPHKSIGNSLISTTAWDAVHKSGIPNSGESWNETDPQANLPTLNNEGGGYNEFGYTRNNSSTWWMAYKGCQCPCRARPAAEKRLLRCACRCLPA